MQRWRIETEVGADDRDPGGEEVGDQIGAPLVGQVDRDVDVGNVVDDRNAVVGAPRSFSVPPTKRTATNSYGNSSSAARTTSG